jgi:hypothetical protein
MPVVGPRFHARLRALNAAGMRLRRGSTGVSRARLPACSTNGRFPGTDRDAGYGCIEESNFPLGRRYGLVASGNGIDLAYRPPGNRFVETTRSHSPERIFRLLRCVMSRAAVTDCLPQC